jgi:glycosyltransferase involved in cell wall biosynthesis
MRVLQVIPAVAPRYGGPSTVIVDMCRGLLDEGVETLVVSTDADGPGRLDVPLGRETRYEAVPALFFPRQWSEAYKLSLPLARALRTLVLRFDVVHVHAVFSHACLAAAAACRRHGVPYVVRPLGTLDPWSLQQKRLRKRVLWHLGVRRMLACAARIHYTTESERRLCEETLGLERGVVVPLGVGREFTPGPESGALRGRIPELGDRPFVLVLSRLHPKKALETLIAAFAAAAGEQTAYHLVLAGSGEEDYVRMLRAEAARRGVGGRVHFPGWLSGPEKVDALRAASLVALASKQENFGVSAAEALACGRPVLVSSAVNLAPEIEDAGAGWVTELGETAVAASLREALRDPGALCARGQAGARLADRRYRWPRICRELVSVYEALGAPGERAA